MTSRKGNIYVKKNSSKLPLSFKRFKKKKKKGEKEETLSLWLLKKLIKMNDYAYLWRQRQDALEQ